MHAGANQHLTLFATTHGHFECGKKQIETQKVQSARKRRVACGSLIASDDRARVLSLATNENMNWQARGRKKWTRTALEWLSGALSSRKYNVIELMIVELSTVRFQRVKQRLGVVYGS